MGLSKKRKVADTKVDAAKVYTLEEASKLMKDINCTKFDSSVDLHIRLGVDPKKADQAIRGTVTLPHGTVKPSECWFFVHLRKKPKQKLQVLIT